MNPEESHLQTVFSGADSPEVSSTPFIAQRRVWVPLGIVVVAVSFFLFRSCLGGTKPAPPVRTVPVGIATAKKQEMDVNYTGLGTVVTLDTVLVRSRVDGQVMKIGFREGQMVRAGELLAEIDSRPFAVQLLQAQGQLAKDSATLKNAEKDLQRFTALAKQGIISTQQEDTQVSLVDQSAAAVKVDQASVAAARLNLTYSHITSPLAGKAGLRQVDAGNIVHAADTTGIVTITPVQPINVMFTLPADQLQVVMGSVHSGRTLAVEAYDRDLTTKLATGTLQAMDNQIDLTTGTIKLKALVKNQDLALFPNQFVNVRLKVDTLHDAVVIPSASLQRSPQGNYLYVVKADGTADLRNVDVQFTDGDSTAVRSGVAAGETVVTEGMEKLKPGALVSLPGAKPKAAPKAGK